MNRTYRSTLLPFKALSIEPQSAAVLRDSSHYVLWYSRHNFSLDFKSHGHFRTHERDKVCDNLVCNPARVSPRTSWIKRSGAVKALF